MKTQLVVAFAFVLGGAALFACSKKQPATTPSSGGTEMKNDGAGMGGSTYGTTSPDPCAGAATDPCASPDPCAGAAPDPCAGQ